MMRHFGERWSTLLAWVAAVPCFLFLSYAPFINHDLLPGSVLLAMIWLADDYLRRPSLRTWGLLVALGAFAALIKVIFAVFWFAVLVAIGLVLLLRRDPAEGGSLREWIGLGCGAALSALLTWIGMAWSMTTLVPDVPFWIRPYEQLAFHRPRGRWGPGLPALALPSQRPRPRSPHQPPRGARPRPRAPGPPADPGDRDRLDPLRRDLPLAPVA